MSAFDLHFLTDNAAFEGEDGSLEVARILSSVAAQVGFGHTAGAIHDVNGNNVGTWSYEVSEDDDEETGEEDDTMAYRIIRYYEGNHDNETVKQGLTLSEAQAHCQDPETSSNTATDPEAVRRTAERGNWFEGYTHV
jgi:hypothetical protein